MDLKKVHCIICEQSIKGFKDIIIHFIKHNDRCPICLSKYSTFSKMYAVSGHYYSQGCNNKRNKINGEPTLQKEFYQRLSKITGDNIEYPTNLSDDPFNHMSQQNLNENLIVNEINLLNENENENENENSLDDSENVILQNEHENDDIEITKKKDNCNLGKELNNFEIEFLKLGLENAKSLKFMQQILDFFKNNTNAINEIRYTIKYIDSIFLANLPIDGHFLSYKHYEESIYYFEIYSVIKLLVEKKNFLEYLDFSKDSEPNIYKNYKSGEQFKKIKNSISDKFILLRIFSDGMSHQGRSDYTIMIDFENYFGPFFKNNKIVLFIVPKEWFHNIHQTIKKIFSNQFNNNKLKIKDNNGNDYEIIPFGLTMDIPEFRSSCRINHYNCNEYSCHTCDKPRGIDYLLKEGNFRNQKDIIDFHNSKPNKQDFLNPENKNLKLATEQKMKLIGITDYDRSWVENLNINYLYMQPDILHNILLGIVQWVLNYIFKKYKEQITNFKLKLKEAKIIPNHSPPSDSLFGVKTRKGRENRSILYYILFITKSNVTNDDFLLLEEMVQLSFLLFQDSFDEDDLDKIKYLVKNFNKKIFLIIPNEPINFHILLHYPFYIKNWGAPKYTSAERFEAQFSKIKDLLTNNTNNQDQHKFERVTKILMATFLDNFNKLKKKEDDNNDLILGQKIKNEENIKFKKKIISDINLHYKNIENIHFHKSIKNSKEIYNVGDGIEVASENSLTGRWGAIIIAICLIELKNHKSVHSIYVQYFDKDIGDQNNKYHFLNETISSILFDNIVNTLIPIQIDSSNYLIIYKCHDQFSLSKKKK
ncbi:hypothetical protein ACTFIZ_008615 [Dictyostelium cf. discoideum]